MATVRKKSSSVHVATLVGREYLGQPIRIALGQKPVEVIFCGWFMGLPMVQLLDEEGFLTGDLHVIKAEDILELPPLIGEPPAVYCPPKPRHSA